MRKAILAFVILGSIVSGSAFAQSAADVQASVDNLSDVLAKDIATRWKWKGDFRFRNENITQAYNPVDRNRDRIRVRLSATAAVNDNTKVEVGFTTTENGDARSGNQTLGDANSKKALDLDLAYVEWQPNALAKVTLGKMKYPWVTTTSYFFDKDVNPEGAAVALNHAPTGVFANVFAADLIERSSAVDTRLVGYQVGMKNRLSDDANMTVAVGYFNHKAVQNQTVTQATINGVFGNTTKSSGCAAGASCLAYDYDVVNALAEVNTKVAGLPATLVVDWAKNDKAPKFKNALAYGVTIGKASLPGSWEVGYLHQKVEKDALFGQWVDSDFGGGNTESQGHAFRGAYQVAKGWKINATYFVNETNINVPTTVAVSVPGATLTTNRSILNRGYHRLQLDLNYAL